MNKVKTYADQIHLMNNQKSFLNYFHGQVDLQIKTIWPNFV